MFAVGNPIFAQSAAFGALPLLAAAFERDAIAPGQYVGPNSCFGLSGSDWALARQSSLAQDESLAEQAYELSCRLCDIEPLPVTTR